MPFYKVSISGSDISLSVSEGKSAIGFYVTRVAYAESAQSASNKVKSMVLAEWTNGKLANRNAGNRPRLSIDRCQEIKFLQGLLKRPSGYTFYQNED
ncbi:MAG TPA: hypothetical protein VNZ27_09100 [Rhodanobacter sp.]|nr:hypothetical protein [Rhodanobacter sp.]